jgi:hypothetical protein
MGNSAFSRPRAPQDFPPQPGEPGFIGPLLPENPQPGQPGFIRPLPNLNPIQQRPYVIQIPPQGEFAGGITIIPLNGDPGIVIKVIPGPVGPAPGPGVPVLPVHPNPLVPAPIVPAPPAPNDPLARIRSHGRNAVIITQPPHAHQWAHYFSEENCPPMIHWLEMATQNLTACMKDYELNQEAAGFMNPQAIHLAITNHLQTSRYHDRAQWGALVRYLHGPSQVGGIRGWWHTNQDITIFLHRVNMRILARIQNGSFN